MSLNMKRNVVRSLSSSFIHQRFTTRLNSKFISLLDSNHRPPCWRHTSGFTQCNRTFSSFQEPDYGFEQSNTDSISSSSSSRAVTSDANNNPDDSCNSMKKVWRSFRFSIRRSLGHEASAPYNQLADSEKQLMFSSPRYATAMFRLLYSLSSSIAAWFMFHNAGFWPLYLGGKKNRKHHSLLGLIRKRPDGIGWGL
mmetsp:Transcript_40696/g.59790  ORF Transcript_40696/g.59790 Transcript_40696/m.59790 type:complete len:196 (-) Transcript_40696:961-1548(-)